MNAGDTDFSGGAGSSADSDSLVGTDLSADGAHGIRLLPYFDPYVIGSHPREKLFPGAAFDRALARGQAGNFPVLLVDGIVAGVWHQKRVGRRNGTARIAITVEPLVALTKRQLAGLEEQAQRIGEVLEGTAELAIGPVAVGPHA